MEAVRVVLTLERTLLSTGVPPSPSPGETGACKKRTKPNVSR